MDRPKKLYDCNGGDSVLDDSAFACVLNANGAQETETRTPTPTPSFRARIRPSHPQNLTPITFQLSFDSSHNTARLRRMSDTPNTPSEDVSSIDQKENLDRNVAVQLSPLLTHQESPSRVLARNSLTPARQRLMKRSRSLASPLRTPLSDSSPEPRIPKSPFIPTTPLRLVDFSKELCFQEVRLT